MEKRSFHKNSFKALRFMSWIFMGKKGQFDSYSCSQLYSSKWSIVEAICYFCCSQCTYVWTNQCFKIDWVDISDGSLSPGDSIKSCVVGVLRGVDMVRGLYLLVTPVPPALLRRVNCLLLGEISLPKALLTTQVDHTHTHTHTHTACTVLLSSSHIMFGLITKLNQNDCVWFV